jgi:hypothetical protein
MLIGECWLGAGLGTGTRPTSCTRRSRAAWWESTLGTRLGPPRPCSQVCQRTKERGFPFFVLQEGLNDWPNLFAVPELMAIRLTPQLSSVLAPLTVHGVFRQAMVLTLNALRGEKDMLMRLLNVFVNEVRMKSHAQWSRNACCLITRTPSTCLSIGGKI